MLTRHWQAWGLIVLLAAGLTGATAGDIQALLDSRDGSSAFVVTDSATNQLLRVDSQGAIQAMGPLVSGHGFIGNGAGLTNLVECDPVWAAVSNAILTGTSAWWQAVGWGNHAAAGYLAAETDPVWRSVSNAITTGATQGASSFAWGNHATNGYLTAFSETDPLWSGVSNAILTGTSAWWQAVGWGNHAAAGYLAAETDPVWRSVSNAVTTGAAQGASAFAWGNHATNDYANSNRVAATYVKKTGDTLTGILSINAPGGLVIGSASNNVMIGQGANADLRSVAIGNAATGTTSSVAIGHRSTASGVAAVGGGAAVGALANARDYGAALGPSANANSYGAAMGRGADGNNYGVAVGYNAGGARGVAVGTLAGGGNFGAAVGESAAGSDHGAAVGRTANAIVYGAAIGHGANGATYGAAVATSANGNNYGAALGRSANGRNYGAALATFAYAPDYGVAIGTTANGASHGVAIGREALGTGTNIAIGVQARAQGANRTAIGRQVTNTLDNSVRLRGELYLDGGVAIHARPLFGAGTFRQLLPLPALGNAVFVATNGTTTGPGTLDRPFNTPQNAYNYAAATYTNTPAAVIIMAGDYSAGAGGILNMTAGNIHVVGLGRVEIGELTALTPAASISAKQRVEGLIIRTRTEVGNTARNIKFFNCRFSGTGLLIYGSDVEVHDCFARADAAGPAVTVGLGGGFAATNIALYQSAFANADAASATLLVRDTVRHFQVKGCQIVNDDDGSCVDDQEPGPLSPVHLYTQNYLRGAAPAPGSAPALIDPWAGGAGPTIAFINNTVQGHVGLNGTSQYFSNNSVYGVINNTGGPGAPGWTQAGTGAGLPDSANNTEHDTGFPLLPASWWD